MALSGNDYTQIHDNENEIEQKDMIGIKRNEIFREIYSNVKKSWKTQNVACLYVKYVYMYFFTTCYAILMRSNNSETGL